MDLLDNYAAGWPYLFIGLAELLAMYWMYGIRNYYRDLTNIMGFSPGFRLKAHITAIYGTVSPLLVGVSRAMWREHCTASVAAIRLTLVAVGTYLRFIWGGSVNTEHCTLY